MVIYCLEHAPFEGPGSIPLWASEREHEFNRVRLYRNEPLPDPRSFDLLVVMGGPMGVGDDSMFPWMMAEKKLISGCLAAGRFVLGICLGSQLLASVLGARVYRNPSKEIGWLTVERRPEAAHSQFFRELPPSFKAFQWHGDTYNLPPDSIHVATSAGCPIQAFEHAYALGLQFHLEMTRDAVSDLVGACANEIGSGPYEQTPDEILGSCSLCDDGKALIYRILDAVEWRIEDGYRW